MQLVLLKKFLQNALAGGLLIGAFVVLISKLSTKSTALLYSAVPVSFLYFTLYIWYNEGRKRSQNFVKYTIMGTAAFILFAILWYLLASLDMHWSLHVFGSLAFLVLVVAALILLSL